MNIAKKILLASAMAVLALCSLESAARELRIKTVDSFTGKPMSGITVETSLWCGREPDVSFTRTSDSQGLIILKRKKLESAQCYVATTDRNYPTTGCVYKLDPKAETVEIEVPVAPIVKPIDLKIQEVKKAFPDGVDKMSFDLMLGDWLAPLGTGHVADVVFTRLPRTCPGPVSDKVEPENRRERIRDALELFFPGEGNGIQDMPIRKECLLWIREAPECGYGNRYELYTMEDENLKDVTNMSFWKGQCFRIRTGEGEGGTHAKCYYGKIYNDVEFGYNYSESPHIRDVRFRYYLNETASDRNLEQSFFGNSRVMMMFRARP